MNASDYPGAFRIVSVIEKEKFVYLFGDGKTGNLWWNNNNLSDVAVISKSIINNGFISLSCGLIIQWTNKMDLNINIPGNTIFEQGPYNYPINFLNYLFTCNLICATGVNTRVWPTEVNLSTLDYVFLSVNNRPWNFSVYGLFIGN